MLVIQMLPRQPQVLHLIMGLLLEIVREGYLLLAIRRVFPVTLGTNIHMLVIQVVQLRHQAFHQVSHLRPEIQREEYLQSVILTAHHLL